MTGGWKRDYDASAVVYLVTNSVNGKRYIGVTSKGPEKRLRQHFSAAKRLGNGAFYRAIRKHGPGVFRIEVLIECKSLRDGYREEIRLISELLPEYNSTKGGDGQLGRMLSEDAKQRIREANTGNSFHLGMKHSDATILLLKAKARRPDSIIEWTKWRSLGPKASARPVRCIDDGRTFDSASAAADEYGVAKSALIELCLGKRGRRTVGGLRFSYAEVV